jgi:hypothetical protein
MAASAGHRAAVPDIPIGSQWEFFGLTYPDTSAGLSACSAEGLYLHETVPTQNLGWECRLNSPDSGRYNLWILFEEPE